MWQGYSRRATSLSKEINAELLLLDTFITKTPKIRKYLLLIDYLIKSFFTIIKLIKTQPDTVIATSPPSFCPMICYTYTRLFNKIFIVDGHNSAFLKPWIDIPFYKIVLKNSNKILIHNQELYQYLKTKFFGYNLYLLPDPLPNIYFDYNKVTPYKIYFLIICSFSDDEPIELILKAIDTLVNSENLDIQFLITGNYKKNIKLYKKFKCKKQIEFLGFLEESDYLNYLVNATAVITISNKSMVQQSAAIESLAAGIPIILENSETNKRIFNKGVVLTELNIDSIKNSIKNLLYNYDKLKKEILQLRENYRLDWYKYLNNL